MLADVIIVAIFALFVFFGYRAGLLKTVINAASYVLAIVIAYFLCGVVTEILIKTPLYDSLYGAVSGNISGSDASFAGIYAEYVSGGIAEEITKLIMKVMAFVILIIIGKIFLSLLVSILNVFARIPVFKSFNATGGAIVGGFVGIVFIYVVLTIVFVCAPALEGSFVLKQINSSWIASFMSGNNVLIYLIG